MNATRQSLGSPVIPILIVRTEDGRTYRFSREFHIGREQDCSVRIEDGRVSRKHVLVSFQNGRWRIADQRSGNGLFVNGRRVETVPIDESVSIRLGADGPIVKLELESPPPPAMRPAPQPLPQVGETMMLESYAERYFGTAASDEPVGGRTMMIRRAFSKVQKRQKRLYRTLVGIAVLVAVSAGWYAYKSRQALKQQQKAAEDLFYTMKALDFDIANIERQLAQAPSQDPGAIARIKEYQARRRQLEENYDRYMSGALYNRSLTPQEQVVMRVTRLFGECDTAAPPEYLAEVGRYIRMWQSTGRFVANLRRAQQGGYAPKIAQEFQKQNLPAQFFYLAMQESGFDELASGKPTRMGIAKGMWQFIPETGQRYGLKIGPLVSSGRPDPADDRHKWDKATEAAARYIKDIYSTDAQASGLLVMASYNWGEGRVIRMLRTMPANPRDRNFWKVLALHRDQVPKETYDYVLNIVSAAAIGEDPRQFGFPFDSPLAFLDKP
jgi:membrane-bound lytic murein transglycosylase D